MNPRPGIHARDETRLPDMLRVARVLDRNPALFRPVVGIDAIVKKLEVQDSPRVEHCPNRHGPVARTLLLAARAHASDLVDQAVRPVRSYVTEVRAGSRAKRVRVSGAAGKKGETCRSGLRSAQPQRQRPSLQDVGHVGNHQPHGRVAFSARNPVCQSEHCV